MKKILLALIIVPILFFSSCEEQSEDTPTPVIPEEVVTPTPVMPKEEEEEQENPQPQTTKYTIAAGSHYADQSSFQLLNVTRLKFSVRFDSSAIYTTVDAKNQADINKLYGSSDCDTHHQVNSARFGWRWFKDALQIWAYVYVNGERKSAYVANVELNETNTYQIDFTDQEYIFTLNEAKVSLPRHCNGQASGYKLYPYFGGDETAPHKVTIEIKDLE